MTELLNQLLASIAAVICVQIGLFQALQLFEDEPHLALSLWLTEKRAKSKCLRTI
jgi:hypothetical protein